MLQYLLNATAIWLISLVMYDVFLRRETYHTYNRFYLLFTFLLGALFPLVQWQGSNYYPATLERPIEQVITAKRTVIEASANAAAFNWQQWLFVIYLTGALVAIMLLIIEIIKLSAYFRSGTRSVNSNWTVIETGREHAPFSFRNTLFVSSMSQYDTTEWNIILAHEKRHHNLFHFFDVLFIQLIKIVFWFHPLVYAYNKRLLLVHEYQADKVSAEQPQQYGKFLVEQALLQSAPCISYSFNRSPIKKRIIMLTRRSTIAARAKMLVFIPLALICFVCFSKNSFSQKFKKEGNMVTYRGNTFELSIASFDTMILIDPVTGKELTKVVQHDPFPIKMNGNLIPPYADNDPYFTGGDKDLRDYLLKSMRTELSKLKDGLYTLDIKNILIDEHGKIVYFEYSEMKKSKTTGEIKQPISASPVIEKATDPEIKVTINDAQAPAKNGIFTLRKTVDPSISEEIDKNLQEAIYDKVCRLMEVSPAFQPGTVNGKKIVSPYHLVNFWNHFKIKDHKIYDMENTGEFKEL